MVIVEAGSVDERDLRIVRGKSLHDEQCHCYEQQLCIGITFSRSNFPNSFLCLL